MPKIATHSAKSTTPGKETDLTKKQLKEKIRNLLEPLLKPILGDKGRKKLDRNIQKAVKLITKGLDTKTNVQEVKKKPVSKKPLAAPAKRKVRPVKSK